MLLRASGRTRPRRRQSGEAGDPLAHRPRGACMELAPRAAPVPRVQPRKRGPGPGRARSLHRWCSPLRGPAPPAGGGLGHAVTGRAEEQPGDVAPAGATEGRARPGCPPCGLQPRLSRLGPVSWRGVPRPSASLHPSGLPSHRRLAAVLPRVRAPFSRHLGCSPSSLLWQRCSEPGGQVSLGDPGFTAFG